MLEIKNLTKRYGKKLVVDNLSFSFEKGKIYGLLGSNGAGKTTTMNMITGYLAPTDGSVIINEHDIQKEPSLAKSAIGYLPEIPPLYAIMNVKEYLGFAAEIKGVAKKDREEEIERVMKLTSVSEVWNKLIKTLSKGYKQRVGLAQALIGNPEILILDEPTVGLDPKQISEIRNVIKELKEEHTVILSSHILAEISAICDEVLIISKGKLIANDNPENLKKILGDTEEITISIVGKADKASSLIRKIPEVKKVESIGKDSDGHNRIKITYVPENDIRETISTTLSDSKILVVEMIRNEASLEEAFLKLTSDGDTEE